MASVTDVAASVCKKTGAGSYERVGSSVMSIQKFTLTAISPVTVRFLMILMECAFR